METDFPLEQDNDEAVTAVTSRSYTMSVPTLLPGQYKHLELLAHLASFSEMLVAVSGPDGSGKTTLAMALSAQCEEPESSLFIAADLMLGLPAILQAIARYWDMPQLPDDLVAARDAVRQAAQEQAENGKSLLIVIDQAEQLDQDTLNAISHFALLAPQTISFALFGTAGFELLFRQSPASAPLHVLELEPLSSDDAALLLQLVYTPGQPLPLNPDELASIYDMSGGWPSALLLAAELFLLDPSVDAPAASVSVDKKPARFPLAHILAIVVVAAALGISFLFRGDDASDAEPEVTEAVAPAVPAVVPQTMGASRDQEPAAEESKAGALSSLETETSEVKPPQVASLPDYNYVAKESNAAVDSPAEEAQTNESSVVKADSADVKAAEPVLKPEPKAAPPVEAGRTYTSAEKTLLATADGFIVQLFGSYQSANAASFRKEWQGKLVGSLYQYQTMHKGKPWHVVVAGVFNTRDEAKAAVDTMPPVLRRQSPWIRDITAVHEALK